MKQRDECENTKEKDVQRDCSIYNEQLKKQKEERHKKILESIEANRVKGNISGTDNESIIKKQSGGDTKEEKFLFHILGTQKIIVRKIIR